MAQGHADAHIVLAELLSDVCLRIALQKKDSEIVFKDSDDDEAIRLLQLALEQGTAQRHLEGMHKIARLYVPLAFTQRIFVTSCRYQRRGGKHFKLAYDAGSTASRFALANMYQLGQSVAQDVTEALKLSKLDAEECCETDVSSKSTEKTL